MLSTFSLKNGIKVATYNIPTVKSIHIGLSVRCGSLVESQANSGVAHFMEHMLVQGIPSYPNAEMLSSYVESLAGHYNASTSSLIVRFNMSVPFSHLEDAIRIASEVFFSPTFPEEAMEKERTAVLNEMKQNQDSQWYKFGEFFRKTRYTKNSILQREIIGKEEIIKTLTRDDLIAYWKTYFHPSRMFLFVGGNFTEKELKKYLGTYMESTSMNTTLGALPTLNSGDIAGRKVAIRHDGKLNVNYLTFSYPSIELDSPTELSMKDGIALDILGRFRSSRLFTLLRYQKGFVYGVSASDVKWPGTGYGMIDSEVATDHLDEVVSLIASTLHEYMEKGPTQKELEFAKHYLSNQWLMTFDNPSSIGGWVEGQLVWRNKILLPEDYILRLESITKDDIIEVMKKHWEMRKLQVIIQGPIKNTQEKIATYTEMVGNLS